MIRILIADDHTVARRGLIQVVSEEPGMQVVGEAKNGQELFALLRRQPCDLVVLDISMPGKSGLDVLSELKHEYRNLPVLVLSMHAEEQYAVRALKSGAAGYLTKDSAAEELLKAIKKVIGGGRYMSLELAERLALEVAGGVARPPHEALSHQEFRVLCLLASGKSITDIATELSLSVKTVSTYRARILEKMSMESNVELIRYAIQNRLVE
ncbi:MAG: DNA-binding response regulator [Candidatus Methylomirabilota bacterium]|nr:response regulator transcription factor [Candidatus Methylomirabilis sp.]NJD67769.1 response regulator transcription factor [candidate division NC10 bacterium]PWB48419.1 MAG: DNA-binding response regulator [candidate division NC10 bacterium]